MINRLRRRLHDWIESLDPIAPGTEENLRQLFESWQGQGHPGVIALLRRFQHACNSIGFYAAMKQS